MRFNVVLTLLLFAAGCHSAEPEATAVDYAQAMRGPTTLRVSATPQDVTDRIFHEVTLTPFSPSAATGAQPDAPPFGIYIAAAVAVQGDSLAYILDRGDHRVKPLRLHASGVTPLPAIGMGEGQGPGELLNPVDLTLSPDGHLHVLDMSGRKVATFDAATGQHITDRRVPFAQKILTAADDSLMLLHIKQEALFSYIAGDAKTERPFGTLIEHQQARGLTLHGYAAAAGKGVVYLNVFTGDLARFSTDGTLTYYRKGIDQIPLPGFKTTGLPESTGFVLDQSASSKVYGPIVHAAGARVTHVVWDSEAREGYLDVYAAATGDYLHSLRLSKPCVPFAITPDVFLGNCNEGTFAVMGHDGLWR
ncbi:MAG: hypothetical protein GVY12_08450 [Bacteroidetes bacterium]|nr:hypothetical protein [Bacteroidota bacterium]